MTAKFEDLKPFDNFASEIPMRLLEDDCFVSAPLTAAARTYRKDQVSIEVGIFVRHWASPEWPAPGEHACCCRRSVVIRKEQTRNIMSTSKEIEHLQRLDREVEREWWWLNGAVQAVAQAQVDGLPTAITQFAEPRRAFDRKRVEIAVTLATLRAS